MGFYFVRPACGNNFTCTSWLPEKETYHGNLARVYSFLFLKEQIKGIIIKGPERSPCHCPELPLPVVASEQERRAKER
jgi:hypothetical protein